MVVVLETDTVKEPYPPPPPYPPPTLPQKVDRGLAKRKQCSTWITKSSIVFAEKWNNRAQLTQRMTGTLTHIGQSYRGTGAPRLHENALP